MPYASKDRRRAARRIQHPKSKSGRGRPWLEDEEPLPRTRVLGLECNCVVLSSPLRRHVFLYIVLLLLLLPLLLLPLHITFPPYPTLTHATPRYRHHLIPGRQIRR
jgi:hypothetical protein